MRLVSYRNGGSGWTPGIQIGDVVVDATATAQKAALIGDWSSVREIVAHSTEDLRTLADAAAGAPSTPLAEVVLGPPVPDPDKILCVGLNYQSHADEAKGVKGAPQEKQKQPVVFNKFKTALIGSGQPVILAEGDDHIDYESELAFVVGKTAASVTPEAAWDHIAGYMPFNDVSARQLQLRSPQWTIGKGFDTSGPSGPALVTRDEVPDPHALKIEGRLNGKVVQRASTGEMMYTVADLLSYISQTITLVPGDIIATGTPAGVAIASDDPVWIKAGDTFEVEIESLGTLTNSFVEPDVAARRAVADPGVPSPA